MGTLQLPTGQLANWTMEQPSAWSPGGFPSQSQNPLRYMVSGPGSKLGVPSNQSGGGQLVKCYAYATQHFPIEKTKEAQESFDDVLHNMEMEIYNKLVALA